MTLDFNTNYMLLAAVKEVKPVPSFFRDRYFPTGAGDIFNSDKVLIEYKKGTKKLAPFVSPRIGDVDVSREGYSVHEFAPAYIGVSRSLSLDDLKNRGFGEAIYPGLTEEQRAAQIQLDDMQDLEERIARREEWMAVQTMINNACTMQEKVDANTNGDTKYIAFFENTSNHTYTVSSSNYWSGNNADIRGDVRNMCKMLSENGLPAADLILGTKAADCIWNDATLRQAIKTDSGIAMGGIDERIVYPGVAFMGTLNFGGFNLNLFSVDETYVDDAGTTQKMFPDTSAMVTAPGCGRMMYGKISQIDYGSTEFSTHALKRVPKLMVDQTTDVRKLRIGTRPVAVPKNYCPFIYAANVCQ